MYAAARSVVPVVLPVKRGDTPGGEGRAETRCQGGEKPVENVVKVETPEKTFPRVADNSL